VAGAFGTLAQALAFAAAEPLDMALVDLNLPDGSGTTLIRTLKQAALSTKVSVPEVLVISVLGDETNVLRAIEAGAGGYLLKDASDIEIAAALQQLHAGGAPLSPSIAVHLMRRLQPKKHASGSALARNDSHLSDKEVQLLRLIAKGLRYEEVGALMGLRYNTVASYAKEIYRKLQVSGRAEAVYEATQLGLMHPLNSSV
jgi:DNA-binding NarL/FixJ family response regulator